jgi:hypothetical protein
VFYVNYLLIKTKLNNKGVNMPNLIQFKKLLLLMLLFSSSTNVFSQTIKSYITNQWQDSRYTPDHENKTVTDKITGLMWKQCAEGLSGDGCTVGTAIRHTYKGAIEYAKNNTFANHRDWRLPNIKELASLVAFDRYHPAINITLFPKTPTNESTNSSFWSSSPKASSLTDAWGMSFDEGTNFVQTRNNSNSLHVRLVRGGR